MMIEVFSALSSRSLDLQKVSETFRNENFSIEKVRKIDSQASKEARET